MATIKYKVSSTNSDFPERSPQENYDTMRKYLDQLEKDKVAANTSMAMACGGGPTITIKMDLVDITKGAEIEQKMGDVFGLVSEII